jgi:hypothetical protein
MRSIIMGGLALALATSSALANNDAEKRGQFYPPAEYDHPFTGQYGTIVVKEWDQAVLTDMGCGGKNPAKGQAIMGCANIGGYKGACIIFVAKAALLKQRGYGLEDIVRHETGHCNGWKHPEGKEAAAKEEKEVRAFHLKLRSGLTVTASKRPR